MYSSGNAGRSTWFVLQTGQVRSKYVKYHLQYLGIDKIILKLILTRQNWVGGGGVK
jgi:hypothetical protein